MTSLKSGRTARLLSPLLLIAAASAGDLPFEPSAEHFADAAACRARLAELSDEARRQNYDAVEGPYAIAAGDVRIHTVRAEGRGHRIAEHRCLIAVLGERSWTHSLEAEQAEFTVESVARTAEWLKHR
jgi:hypothetical protein